MLIEYIIQTFTGTYQFTVKDTPLPAPFSIFKVASGARELFMNGNSDEETLAEVKKTSLTTVIREVYDGVDSQERFEYELECALEAKSEYIVIEPTKLGEETSRWIIVGNSLHKASVLSGLASMLVPAVLPPFNTSPFHLFFQTPTSLLSVACAALYGISWQFDPCCKYQVTVDSNELSNLRVENLTNASPVVLVRRDDKYRKILHNSVAIMSSVFLIRTVNTVWNEIS